MSGVFINYRRDDAKSEAGRLFDWLSRYFGKDQVFMDVSGSIEPGLEFDRVIEKAVSSCDVLIVVIGKAWLTALDEKGKRRLEDPNDFVRMEVAAALRRDIRVIPVLVQGAVMPEEGSLPEDLKRLSKRQASEISDNRWEFDTEQLVKVLEKVGVKAARHGQTVVPDERPAPTADAISHKKIQREGHCRHGAGGGRDPCRHQQFADDDDAGQRRNGRRNRPCRRIPPQLLQLPRRLHQRQPTR